MSDKTEKDEPVKQEPLSRRDFLRRAGKEAVDTGTRLVPGGNLARQALGMEVSTSIPWWNVMSKWRKKKLEQKNISEEQDTGTND